jgi:hypothetical protein
MNRIYKCLEGLGGLGVRIGCCAALLAIAAWTPAQAQTRPDILRAVARIEQIDRNSGPEVMLLRSGGERRPAAAYDYLFAGDRLRLTGQSTRVRIRRARGIGFETLTAEQATEVTFERRRRRLPDRLREIAARLAYWWNEDRRAIPTAANSRTHDVNLLSGLSAESTPLRPVLQARQLISADRELVVPVWAGEAARLTVAGADGSEPSSSLVIGKYATRISLPAGIPRATLTLSGSGGSGFAIEVTRDDARTVLPDWIRRDGDSPEGRLAAAAWLAMEGPPEWRLEGYSRLTELAAGDLAAQSIWEALTREWVLGRAEG